MLAIPLTRRWKLQEGAVPDLTPSMHWPEPVIAESIDPDHGPVMVTVEYTIESKDREAFLALARRLGRERKRNGAYAWGVFEDAAQPGRFVEVFYLESWLEHERQHGRLTKADRSLEEQVRRFAVGKPLITHFIAASDDRAIT